MTVDLDPIRNTALSGRLLNARSTALTSRLPDAATAGAAEVTTVQPGETKCSWCGQDLQPRRGGSPQRFCSAEHRSLFWSTLRRWGARAVAAGILTIASTLWQSKSDGDDQGDTQHARAP